MSDLVQFLRARLDEDEQIAGRAASYDDGANHDVQGPEGTWVCLHESEWFGPAYRGGVIAPRIGHANAPELGAHIVAHDPARVLREVGAKRQLVDEYALTGSTPDTPERRASKHWAGDFEYLQGLARAVRLMASAYAGHPDYREEWRP